VYGWWGENFIQFQQHPRLGTSAQLLGSSQTWFPRPKNRLPSQTTQKSRNTTMETHNPPRGYGLTASSPLLPFSSLSLLSLSSSFLLHYHFWGGSLFSSFPCTQKIIPAKPISTPSPASVEESPKRRRKEKKKKKNWQRITALQSSPSFCCTQSSLLCYSFCHGGMYGGGRCGRWDLWGGDQNGWVWVSGELTMSLCMSLLGTMSLV
jgi:hypothetical protein